VVTAIRGIALCGWPFVVADVVKVVVEVVVAVVVAVMVTPPSPFFLDDAIVPFHLLPIRTPSRPARALADSSIGDLVGTKRRQQQHHQQHTNSNTNLKTFHKSYFALFLCSGKKGTCF
jgi:hypothetical protein